MLKSLYLKYGATVIIIAVLLATFFIGFAVGRVGKSAPSLEAIEQDKAKPVSSVCSQEPVSEAAPQYTEIEVNATAYCACVKCCGKSDGITATGVKATAGRTIAVDPSVIPYGTKLLINGNTYVAEDCGGKVIGNDIDIYFNTHAEAVQFGRQTLTAFILN